MTNKTLKLLETAYETRTRDDGDVGVFFNDDNPLQETLRKVQFELQDVTGTWGLNYQIMARACELIVEHWDTKNSGKDISWEEIADGSASIYTAERLAYLYPTNQQEISDIMREYSLGDVVPSIATACAVWYDNMVAHACRLIIDRIK